MGAREQGVLVVGAGGFIGSRLAAHFAHRGWKVHRASHRPGAEIPLDLSQPLAAQSFAIPAGTRYALLCSANAAVDACFDDPVGSRRLNVEHTIELLQRLIREGVVPVFFSAELVFRGDRGDYREDDPREPQSLYGEQKKEVEDFLFACGAPYLILRLSKIFDTAPDDNSSILQILRNLTRGERVRAAVDLVICPTDVRDLCRMTEALLERGERGVFHVSNPQRFTRYELAMRLAELVGRPDLVEKCDIASLRFRQPRPPDASLNAEKIQAATGLRFGDFAEALPRFRPYY